jgi:trehalose 6-phosphate phosphatase
MTQDSPPPIHRPSPGDGNPLPAPSKNWALFLDVDGTLVELASEPDSVCVESGLVSLLTSLQTELGGAVALVSGRSVDTLDRLFSPLHLPAAGNHGLERRGADGVMHQPAPDADMPGILHEMEVFAAQNPGVIVENKTLSMALHFRNCPQVGSAATMLAEGLIAARSKNLFLQKGKMMVEIRPDRGDKGSAIADFMTESPFHGRIPVFIGDDVTDESGFAVVNSYGGHSVRVGNGSETAAAYRVQDVTEVNGWLKEIVKAEI